MIVTVTRPLASLSFLKTSLRGIRVYRLRVAEHDCERA